MYMIEYLAYHVHPFSVTHLDKALAPTKPTTTKAPAKIASAADVKQK
jgi:hypothetical protein